MVFVIGRSFPIWTMSQLLYKKFVFDNQSWKYYLELWMYLHNTLFRWNVIITFGSLPAKARAKRVSCFIVDVPTVIHECYYCKRTSIQNFLPNNALFFTFYAHQFGVSYTFLCFQSTNRLGSNPQRICCISSDAK